MTLKPPPDSAPAGDAAQAGTPAQTDAPAKDTAQAGKDASDAPASDATQAGKDASDAPANDAAQAGTSEQTGGPATAPPLPASLAGLSRLHGRPLSLRRLCAYLPGGFAAPGVEDCLRAAETLGAAPRLLALAALSDIPQAALPCVILLDDSPEEGRRSCILLEQRREEGRARIILPENDPEESWTDLDKLQKDYSGHAVFLPQSAPPGDPRSESLTLVKAPHWFWGVLKEFSPIYRDAAIASLVVNMLSLATPLFIMNVYDRVVPNNAIYTLWVLVLGVLLAYCMDFMLRNLRGYFVDTAGRNADVIVTSRLMDRILHMRLEAKPESTGGLVNNLREIEQVRDFFGSATLLALFDLPFLFLFVLIIAFIGGPMVLLLLFAVPLMLLFVWLVQLPFRRAAERQFKRNMQKNSLLVEITAGLETIKSILAQGHMKNLWENVVDASAKESAHSRRLASLAQTGALFITQLLNAGVIITGVYLINEGKMTQGGLIACVILMGRALGPLSQIASMLTQMQRSRIALQALEQIIKLPAEQDGNSGVDCKSLEASPALQKVSFRYPRSAKNALSDITLRIRPGEKVGFMGPTGSGKSTLARLLVGLYQPTDGSVSFGGVDIRQIDQADLRSRVALMPQDNYLFYGSVRENIALGCPWTDMKSVVRAAELAGVADFVALHPRGYEMQVGERGMDLSGGQRQAVALARTLVRSPDVLILDEPSSNLDMESELKLVRRLQKILHDKTVIIMTHRPSLLSLVDRVVVLNQGTVAADGPRDGVLRALQRGLDARRTETAEKAAPYMQVLHGGQGVLRD